ncbi:MULTISPECIES: DUF934 domain-containing protein [Xanthobacter]|uniref:DUF934 domain-containing protein n=1 Tax=Xanthobacter TaxID=279 RepID=UPI001F36D42F|nr:MULTISPECIES: DUF934 domain-containing protein [unclassified Xanthobacter]
MPLVKSGTIIADPFTAVADDAPLPDGPTIVSAARLLANKEALFARNVALGVAWPNNRDVAELEPLLPRLALVALAFPKFRDGRAFSQARLLRERYGFTGELRATGNVLRDQLLMMARAGFDAFELEKAADAGTVHRALTSYSIFYQPTGDGRRTAAETRRAAKGRLA